MNVFAFLENPSICPVQSLKDYLTRTAPLQNADAYSVIISTIKPYHSVSAQTLARWIKQVMAEAGIDTSNFKQHSIRSTLAFTVAQICKQAQ